MVVQPRDGAVVVQGATAVTGLRVVTHRVGTEVPKGGEWLGVEKQERKHFNQIPVDEFGGISDVKDLTLTAHSTLVRHAGSSNRNYFSIRCPPHPPTSFPLSRQRVKWNE